MEQKQRMNDYLFPKYDMPTVSINTAEEKAYITNDVVHRNILVYGAQGQGKTEFIRSLAEKLAERYPNESVSILSRYFPKLINSVGVIPNKPIQMYVWEDATLKRQKDNELAAFFNIRHLFQAKTGMNKGILYTVNVEHDLTGISKKIRSNYDAIFFRSLPNNEYDARIAKSLLGEDNYNVFQEVIKNRDLDPKLRSITYYNIRGETGFFDWPLAKKNYLIDIDTPREILGYVGPTPPQYSPFWKAYGVAQLVIAGASIIFFAWLISIYISILGSSLP